MAVYRNPLNGYTVHVGIMSNIAVFVFSFIFFIYKGYWRQFWIMFFTCGLAWLWYLFFIQGAIRNHYLERGWRRIR